MAAVEMPISEMSGNSNQPVACTTGEENGSPSQRADNCEIELGSIKPVSENGDSSIKVEEDVADIIPHCESGPNFWYHPLDFLISCVSMTVGLGNIWKFPMVAYQNGGGAFLVPYTIVTFLIGRPLLLLEMALGQFTSSGPVQIWEMAPFFKGVGYSAVLGSACVLTYYVSLMGTAFFYILVSFSEILPWTECDTAWTSEELCINGQFQFNQTDLTLAQIYYSNKAFPQWSNFEDGIGLPCAHLTICLFVSWFFVFISLVNGVRTSGKVAYFTTIFPFSILLVFFCRGAMMSGGIRGMQLFIAPDWNKILDLEVWHSAFSQCFFSLSVGSGPVIMFASYNSFNHNIYRDGLIISIVDLVTSLVAGFTTFAFMGNLAESRNISVGEIDMPGFSLTFALFPDVISRFETAPKLFSVLFFSMIFTLGLGSSVALTGGIVKIVGNQFPHLKKWAVTLVVCSMGFLIGLIYLTPAGIFFINLVDFYGAGFVIYVAVILEIIGIFLAYGMGNICRDIHFMLGSKTSLYWKLSWTIIIPLSLGFILFDTLTATSEQSEAAFGFLQWAKHVGWVLATISLALPPIFAIRAVYSRPAGSTMRKLKESLRPTDQWGPKEGNIRTGWVASKTN